MAESNLLQLTRKFMRVYIDEVRKHPFYKAVRPEMAREIHVRRGLDEKWLPRCLNPDIRDEYQTLVFDTRQTILEDLTMWTLSDRVYCGEAYTACQQLADSLARSALTFAVCEDENLDPIFGPGTLESVSERRAA